MEIIKSERLAIRTVDDIEKLLLFVRMFSVHTGFDRREVMKYLTALSELGGTCIRAGKSTVVHIDLLPGTVKVSFEVQTADESALWVLMGVGNVARLVDDLQMEFLSNGYPKISVSKSTSGRSRKT